MNNLVKNIYIHIPFCTQICSYCDFSKVYYNDYLANKYLLSLEKEIDTRYKNEVVDTIYIGGGSPSSLNIVQLNKLFNIIKKIKKNKKCSITFECNSADLDNEKIKLLSENNVNRVSIGIQSFNKKILKILNRESNYFVIEKTIKNLNDVGIFDINVDLIYGVNSQTLSEINEDLEKILKLNITHISTYSLILEKNTILYNKNYKEIEEDDDYNMYKFINETLIDEGFINYEISNYSKIKYESKHNLCYWDNNHYYGFGVGASSYIENKRFSCINNFKKYINFIYEYDEEIIDNKKEEEYEFILGFRKIEGINKENFSLKFNKDIMKNEIIKKLVKENKLLHNDSNLFINSKYIYLSNEILLDFIN